MTSTASVTSLTWLTPSPENSFRERAWLLVLLMDLNTEWMLADISSRAEEVLVISLLCLVTASVTEVKSYNFV